MLSSFFLIFFSIFLAQIGDKTQLITLLLASKTKKHLLLFIGVMIGFTIGVALAVLVGAKVSSFIPHNILKIISSAIFVIIGLFLLFKKEDSKKHKQPHSSKGLVSTSIIIFLADFGDKTQIALALFATSHNPLLVFAAGLSALGLATLLAIYLSKLIARKIKQSMIEKIAGVAFILIGILFFFL